GACRAACNHPLGTSDRRLTVPEGKRGASAPCLRGGPSLTGQGPGPSGHRRQAPRPVRGSHDPDDEEDFRGNRRPPPVVYRRVPRGRRDFVASLTPVRGSSFGGFTMKRTAIAIAMTIGAAVLAQYGSAQAPGQPGRGGPPNNPLLQAFDTDHDGTLSAA